MSPDASRPRAGLSGLLADYARPFSGWIALLVAVTAVGNLLIVTQPLTLASILWVVLGKQGSPLAGGQAASGTFSLNHLGQRVLEWLGLGTASYSHLLGALSAIYILQSALSSALDYLAYWIALRIKVGATRLIQSRLYAHLLDLDLRFFHRQRSGELLSRMTQDSVNTAQGIGPLVRSLLHHAIQLIAYGIYLTSTNLRLSLAAAAFVLAHFGLTQLLKRPIRRQSRSLNDAQAELLTAFQEGLQGIRLVKSFSAEEYEKQRLQGAIKQASDVTMRYGSLEKLELPFRSIIDALGIVSILLVAAIEVRAGRLTTEGLLMYVYIGQLILAPANHMATSWLWGQALIGSSSRIAELMGEKPALKDGTATPAGFTEGIELRNVSFSYQQEPAVSQVSLSIRKGETLAIVGRSGSGKSTLADLILRLYDPDSGEILMDGVGLDRLQQSAYRRLFGVVSQETLLFHDTIRNNIRFGRSSVSNTDIEQAAKLAHASGFIAALPDGMETVVGERGLRLSGGERQRVALARAIVHKPQILILDEATSALDSESERHIQEALEMISGQTTLLIIAHRFSTVRTADKIVVMDAGCVVAAGTHEELLRMCPLYRKLYQLQSQAQPEVYSAEGAGL